MYFEAKPCHCVLGLVCRDGEIANCNLAGGRGGFVIGGCVMIIYNQIVTGGFLSWWGRVVIVSWFELAVNQGVFLDGYFMKFM